MGWNVNSVKNIERHNKVDSQSGCIYRQTDVILLDFSKAFDKVSHKKIIHKLHGYGIRGKTLSWIKAFLNDMSQTVVLEWDCSEEVPVTSGVPQ